MHRRPSRRALLQQIAGKADQIMSQQTDIDAATKAIQDSLATLSTAITAIDARITDLESKVEPPADMTSLQQATSDLAQAADAVAALGTQAKKTRSPRGM